MGSPDEKQPRSMRDFDYFDDAAKPVSLDDLEQMEGDLPSGLEAQLEAFQRRQKRHARYILLMAITVGAMIWFLAGQRALIAYAFASPAQEPRQLGNVTEMLPRDIPHNAYVALSGITEHRGMTQKASRGLSLGRKDLWYFRLVGSRGVFIEVEADKNQYSTTMEVEVTGRAVDPEREHGFGALLRAYYETFPFSKQRPQVRIIQVGIKPGQGRWPYLVAFAFAALLIFSNLWMLWRLLRARRPVIGVGPGRSVRQ